MKISYNYLKRVVIRTIEGYFSNEVGKTAAALTYYFVFALFPFLIFISSVLGFLNLPMITVNEELLPADVVTFVNLAISHITEVSSGGWLTFGLIFTIWFPLRAVKSILTAINRIYGERTYQKHTFRALFLTFVIILFIPILLILLFIGEKVLTFIAIWIPLAEEFILIWSKIRFLPITIGGFILICSIYILALNDIPKKRYILSGAILSLVMWLIFSLGFAYYVDNISNYSAIYGSISVIIAFLVWLNSGMVLLLMGAIFNKALLEESNTAILNRSL